MIVSMKVCKIISQSAKETQDLAYRLGQLLPSNSLLTLSGELGAGKTTFTQGLAKGLQIKEKVTSPTFTLMKMYQGRLPLYHIDAYRLENISQDLGFDEFIDGDGVCVIEWSNFIDYLLPNEKINIEITSDVDENRTLVFTANGTKYEEVLEKLCIQ